MSLNAVRKFIILSIFGLVWLATANLPALTPDEIAATVTIVRDTWGVAHVDAPTDTAVVFGFAYAQCEDYYWQVEDVYLQSIGRYSEATGKWGLKADLLNHNFEVARRSQEDFPNLAPESKAICEAFAAGLNYYLAKNPQVKPRVITQFEPWMVLAYGRWTMLYWVFERVGATQEDQIKMLESWRASAGSNLWVIGPSRTKDKTAMLYVNPHQPWFGPGQFWEGHVHSGEGWNFTGATFFGGPFPSMGHNEDLGWTHTANKPDGSDLYRVVFDDPANPLNYKYGDGHKTAIEWTDVIKIKDGDKVEERKYTFRKTHHGPVVKKEDDKTYLACRMAKLFDGDRVLQAYHMTKAKNYEQWCKAVGENALMMFNIGYADKAGNILYMYNGTVPERDAKFDFTKPLDGSDPKTEWTGMHSIDELPQVFNPPTGWVQNCNQGPFTTTDDYNPYLKDFPAYMVGEKFIDNRRAMVSRLHLRNLTDVTFESFQKSVVDPLYYWPMTELPRLKAEHEKLKTTDAELAAKVEPYLQHLLDWDFKGSAKSTQATLCFEFYEELYGRGFPTEDMKPEYMLHPELKFQALVRAAENLEKLHGTWKVPYGDVFRIQRHTRVLDMLTVPFKDNLPSEPCVGGSGVMGTSYNVYYTASNAMRKKRFGIVGGSYMGVYEFSDHIKGVSLLQFGESADPKSPHYFDQAKLYSESKFKPAWFYWDDVMANVEATYRPGQKPDAPATSAGQ